MPDFVATNAPSNGSGQFIMNPEGVSRLWARTMLVDGPFPAHYGPSRRRWRTRCSRRCTATPVARVFGNDMSMLGDAAQFPIVATTYRLTEHFHYWTKNVHINAVLQAEILRRALGGAGAGEGHRAGPDGRASGRTAARSGRAMVTKRLRPLTVDGKTVHTVGIPLHFGFIGETKKAAPVNSRTPPVAATPEYKAFLVDIEPVAGPVAHRTGRADLRRGRPDPPLGQPDRPAGRAPDRGGEAHRRLQVHRPQGVPGGLPRMERDARGGRLVHRPVGEPARPDRQQLHADALRRAREPGDRQPRVADPQGRLHALRGSGLPEGLPGARARSCNTRTASSTSCTRTASAAATA